jgi:hypothetical protein
MIPRARACGYAQNWSKFMPSKYVDDDIFDERGLLRDGKTYRVGTRFMDSAPPRVVARQRPGFATGFIEAASAARRQRAYDSYLTDLTNAWRGDADERWGEEGDQCTVREGGVDEGSPGHLGRINGRLVCVPDRDDDHRSLDQRMSDHKQLMDDEYARFDERLRNQWRGGGK